MTGKKLKKKKGDNSKTDDIFSRINSIDDSIFKKSTGIDKGTVVDKNIKIKKSAKTRDIYKQISTIKEPTLTRHELDIPTFSTVYLTYNAYKNMIGYAIRYANDKIDNRKWKEVYGVLIGTIKGNKFVLVKDAIPLSVGGRSGVELEPIHYVDIAEIDALVYKRAIEDGNTDFIIGWWHTHPGFGFFFSGTDRVTQLGFQGSNPYAVGLIFDHTQKRGESLGVAALRLRNPERGTLSDHIIVKLSYDVEIKTVNKNINKVIEEINKNMDKVLKELNYIHNVLDKKLLRNLEKEYGLLVEKEGAQRGEGAYVWGLGFRKEGRKPKFRKRIETEIMSIKENLKDLTNKSEDILNSQQKIKNMLFEPNNSYSFIIEKFIKIIDIINPYYDYLDSNERKIIENFELRLNNYYEILDQFNNIVASFSRIKK